MNFDKIKKIMDESDHNPFHVEDIDLSKKSTLPIKKIRQSMKSEIVTQLIFIIIFFAVLFVKELNPLPFSVYLIFMSLTSMMTLMYLAKMMGFVRKTSTVDGVTRSTIMHFIYELKLTLEVYKTAIIAGSLLLPIPMFALFAGQKTDSGKDIFSTWFLLDISSTQIMFALAIFLVIAVFIYIITVKWADALYGRHIRNLEGVLKEIEED